MLHEFRRSDWPNDKRLDRIGSSASQPVWPSCLVLQMHLWNGERCSGRTPQEWPIYRLWLLVAGPSHKAWHEEATILPCLERHGSALSKFCSPEMARLRRPWDHSVRGLARPRPVLARHGTYLHARPDHRADRRERQLRSFQLHLDPACGSVQEPQVSRSMACKAERPTTEARR